MELVVAAGAPVVIALSDKCVNELLAFGVCESLSGGEESVFEVDDGLLSTLEARQIVLPHEHHLYDYNNFFGVLLESQESLLEQLSVFGKCMAVIASQHLHLLRGQLERCFLELEAFAGRVAQKESEINVHDVALDVD